MGGGAGWGAIEVHLRLGCVGVSTDALDRISFRVGCIITTIIIALVFVRGLFVDIVFCFFMRAWVLALALVLLFGLRFSLALR